ncbi:uncharacterized protein N7503_005323 [Penicillium pulvis]|uniref:uncharacterized protein n=1 Tax=Penicillium pulvis TaxID=1562058 RepID=UPI00254770F8|nr:uncharacterized protein N7503_005323 [Penicillium pulvis]KAJ5802873.1 hypothetical protein N7503_005323 [Penicillium pulvis]
MDSASASLIYELLRSDTAAELDRVKRVKVTQPDLDSPDHEAALESWKREIDHFDSRPQEFIAALERINIVQDPEPDDVSADGDHADEGNGVDSYYLFDDDTSSESSADQSAEAVTTDSDGEVSLVSRSSSLSLLSATPSLSDLETDVPASNQQECIACMEALPAEDMSKCPCSHYYCNSCIESFVEATLADISLFPPKCCGTPIPWSTIKPALRDSMVKKFEERLAEVNKPPPPVPQTICSDKRCLTPIPADRVHDHVGICPKCKCSTCTFCGNESHPGDCNNKKEWKKLEITAKQRKWKMCPTCKAFVERTYGCNHIRSLPPPVDVHMMFSS